MKKILKVLVAFMLSIVAVGCFSSNVDLRPKDVYVREFKGLRVKVARSDLSGIFLDVESRAEHPVSILWGKSSLGGSEIVRHDGIINTSVNQEETVLNPLERKSFVIHRKVDFYFLDPALYAQGGLRIKPLKYPVELKLMTKMLGKEELISIFIDNNYQSNENASSSRYQEDAYALEKKENINQKDKDYQAKFIDERTKADSTIKTKESFQERKAVKDSLIIEHRNK